MAKSNRDRIGVVLDTLKEGLGPFVLREYYNTFGAQQFLIVVQQILTTGGYAPEPLPDINVALETIDVQGYLNLMVLSELRTRSQDNQIKAVLSRF